MNTIDLKCQCQVCLKVFYVKLYFKGNTPKLDLNEYADTLCEECDKFCKQEEDKEK